MFLFWVFVLMLTCFVGLLCYLGWFVCIWLWVCFCCFVVLYVDLIYVVFVRVFGCLLFDLN